MKRSLLTTGFRSRFPVPAVKEFTKVKKGNGRVCFAIGDSRVDKTHLQAVHFENPSEARDLDCLSVENIAQQRAGARSCAIGG